MEKWILENWLSPGDIVMLTAAVRDLHRAYPGRFLTDLRTSCPDLWRYNPHVSPLVATDADVRTLRCHYPLIHRSNRAPYHFIHGFIEHLNEELGLSVRATEFKGDMYLSEEERARPSAVQRQLGGPLPYWIIAAGGKYDFTLKWWHRRRWQEVVDQLQGQVRFVQVGESGHYHPPLHGVLDWRGKTSLRDLVLLVYHADGVLCPVTLLMHLAAAVPLPPGRKRLRGCVVVAGGREPAHWEQYPGHQFHHTIGQLECCADGGCWRSRTVPLGDGSELDLPGALCTDVTSSGLARCMDLITASDIAASVLRSCSFSDSPPILNASLSSS